MMNSVLSRVIYADGTSDYYTLNDAKVRLKDVQELLAFAGIGEVLTQPLTKVKQIESCLLLQRTQRSLEDALGLRVYHIRLNESRRKLEKVKIHVHEVELLRKEIAPHYSTSNDKLKN